MTASAESRSSLSTTTMAVPDVEYIVPSPGYEKDLAVSQRMFKKNKVLPHPRSASGSERSSGGAPVNHHKLRHQRRKISGVPDLPPTPPAHSRTSSSSHSIVPTSPLLPATPDQSSESVPVRAVPTTPPSRRSPPTRDVTPPQANHRPKAPRPTLYERFPSKSTTDSRTESFKTARENPESSDEDDGKSTLRPGIPSARTSQNTVRQANGNVKRKPSPRVGLGLGLESSPEEANPTPGARGEFITFDGDWGFGNEVEQEWDDNLMRNVTVRKRRPKAKANGQKQEVVEDNTVSPTNAAKAVRAMPLQGRVLTFRPGETFEPIRRFTAPEASISDSSGGADVRRLSGMSTKSTVSTVVEAILVDTPPRRQQKTLRHVKRVSGLRDSISGLDTSTFDSASISREGVAPRPRPTNRIGGTHRGSYASNNTVNSISSRKARRDIWKNGGIPVVIVPDRRSSNASSSRERSLRSTSSKKSKRSQSLSSVPLSPSQISRSLDLTPYFDRPPGRGRTRSESDGSTPGDQRTMDYPPAVPRRTSSLSAPTSRNGSRSGSREGSRAPSLTAESLRVHDAAIRANGGAKVTTTEILGETEELGPGPGPGPSVPALTVEPAPPVQPKKSREIQAEDDDHPKRPSGKHLNVAKSGDSFWGKRRSTQATPFSQASVETTGTSAAEISEAVAVSIVPHQNTSVLRVDHRPSESSDSDRRSQLIEKAPSAQKDQVDLPTITTTDADGVCPVTPPQAAFSMDDVDSPLRNPRAPPEPPAIKFIPATPSGLTPAEEKARMLGNYFEETDEKPARTRSLVQRALGRRQHSSYGPSPERSTRPSLLTRALSLSRTIRKDTAEISDLDRRNGAAQNPNPYPTLEDRPRDETRLHPGWRPAHSGYAEGDDDGVYDVDDEGTMRYPPIDNRPHPPKRSISSRMKRTFAILPPRDDYDDYDDYEDFNEWRHDDWRHANGRRHDGAPDRRALKRTPSGSWRVVKSRGSAGSLRRRKQIDERPVTAPEGPVSRRPRFWRSYSLRRHNTEERSESAGTGETKNGGRFLPVALGNKIAEYNLPRRLSERRREKRSQELRQKISAPREVRDGVGEVIRRSTYRDAFTQAHGTCPQLD